MVSAQGKGEIVGVDKAWWTRLGGQGLAEKYAATRGWRAIKNVFVYISRNPNGFVALTSGNFYRLVIGIINRDGVTNKYPLFWKSI